MGLKMPNVVVSFKEKGITAIERSERGIIAMVLEESAPTADIKTVYTVDDIPQTLSDYNKEQIGLALMGYQTSPRKIVVLQIATPIATTTKDADGKDVQSVAKQDYTEVLKRLENVRFDWLVIPALAAENTDKIASWIKGMRTTKDIKIKAVLANCPADNEGVVNFTNSIIKTKTKSYTTADYCARVAGIICGTPATISCTYAPVAELVEVENETSDERDARVGKGEFFFFSDGEKIKVARGINSFVTTIQGKGVDFQKIKLVDLMDMIHDDIKKTGHDSYIGKYANSYDNRCLLITAINGYFHTLETEGLLEHGQNRCYVDVTAVKDWRESNGLNTRDELEAMKEQELKELNLHDNVFISCDLSLLDAIENITVNNSIE